MASDTRKQPRLPRDFEVVWAIPSRGLSGRGKLVDVSAGGVCIEINQPLQLTANTPMSLMCSRLPQLPSTSSLQWARKSGTARTICGLRFVNASSTWASWIAQQGVEVAAK